MNTTVKVEVKLLSQDGRVPTKAHSVDAGWDIYSDEDISIPAKCRKMISSGIAVSIPNGYYGQLKDRSSVANKRGCHIFAGVIDSEYTGPLGIVMYNSSDEEVKISKGERIAQMVILPVPECTMVLVDDLSKTDRGVGGFGSSGI